MSNISFKNFGYVAEKVGYKNIFISSSRYEFQKKNLPIILENIKKKLKLTNNDTFLDIGCGLGLFLIPLSFFSKNAYGIDHKNFINKIKKNFKFFDFRNLISGNFLKLRIKKKFDKILIYSVVHYLSSEIELVKFMKKALNILKKDGIILIGDIPIYEYEKKFLNSKEGRQYYKIFNTIKNSYKKKSKAFNISNYLNNRKKDNNLICINLKLIKKLKKNLEKKNYKVKVLRHTKYDLYGKSRIDIIINK